MSLNQWCRRLPPPAGVLLIAAWMTAGLVRAGVNQPAPSQPHPQIAELRKQIAGREKDPAEQVFKNIQTFKGMPAATVLAIMEQAFVPNLGVECTHCHVEGDWASDSKPPKQVARAMWVLRASTQEQVRKATGNPDAVVTCYMCHKGQPKPAFQPPAAPAREALARELARVDAASGAVPGDQRAGLDARLARARTALDAGRLHLAIYDLEAVFTASAAFGVAREADGVKTVEDFERRWASAGAPVAARRGGAIR